MNIDAIVATFRLHGEQKQRLLIRRLQADEQRYLPMLQAIYAGDYPPSIQRWAIEAMGTFPAALKTMRSALKHSSMSVRLHAMIGIDSFNDPKNVRYIRPLLADESGGIRLNALDIAAKYRPRWLRSELTRLANDEKSYIRNRARKLLDVDS